MTPIVRYHRVAMVLHWLIAGLIITIIPLGFLMGNAPDAIKLPVYQLHKTIGMSILFLSLLRLGWRWLNPPPPLVASLKAWERAASKAVHSLFYLLMIGTPLLGWAVVSTSSRGTPTILFGQINWPHLAVLADMEAVSRKQLHNLLENVHEYAAFMILGLLVLHVGAGLKHHFIDKDATATKMVPGLGKATEAPAKGRGLWVLLAGLLALFAGWVLLGGSAKAPVQASATAANVNWQIDHENSTIEFGFRKNGKAHIGHFTNWNAAIYFDPNDVSAANTVVKIAAFSAYTDDIEARHSLPGSGWLDADGHRDIVWRSSDFTSVAPEQYLARGELVLRGFSVPFDLPFDLRIDADGTAHMQANTSLMRLAFGIGTDDDGGAEWVDDLITITINLTANPAGG